ncbi:MAG: molybdenum cofactor guanylyltransferase [Solirubrobacteraceae bacterium]|nr:molybdenum cofactor guanylyltransferase [Solirubrobacteraceae bacterium]
MSAPVGVVLAGGAGSRVGGDKAALPVAGRPLISWPLAALRAVLAEVAVVAKEATVLPPVGYGVLVWREPDEPRHPLAGVVEALRRAGGRPVVVLACDLPLVTPALVRALAEGDAGGAPALVARAEGRLQPLCARYEPAARALLEGFDGSGRVVTQIEALGPAVLEVEAALLRNVNTPQDAAAVTQSLGRLGVTDPP